MKSHRGTGSKCDGRRRPPRASRGREPIDAHRHHVRLATLATPGSRGASAIDEDQKTCGDGDAFRMSSQLPRGIHVADATTMMQKYSLLPGATLVALLSLDCAAGSGSQDSPFSASSVDGGTGASSSSGGSSGSGTSGGSGGSSGGQGLNPVTTGDDAGASASDDATTGDDGSFTVTGTGEGDASTTASGHHSGNGGSSSGGNTGSSSGGNTGSSSGGTVGTNTGGAMPTVADGDGGKSYATLPYRGLAMSGAEFGASVGGLFNGTTLGSMPGDYYYPTTDSLEGRSHLARVVQGNRDRDRFSWIRITSARG